MAEEQQGQEKTEEATPRKLEKAKQDGQLARSRELNSVAIVTFGAVAAIATLPGVAVGLANQTVSLFQRAGDPHHAAQGHTAKTRTVELYKRHQTHFFDACSGGVRKIHR